MLQKIRTMLGLKGTDQDGLLNEIIDILKSRVCMYVQEEELPEALEYIVIEASVSRFNRIRSEGTTTHTVEGESWTWAADDLAPYKADLQAWLEAQKNKTKGRVRFI